MADEPVKRKADTTAKGSPKKTTGDAPSTGEATTDLLTWTPTTRGVVRFLLSSLLFGGVVLAGVGAVLFTESLFGVYAAVAVAGVACIVVAVLIAQVAARAGYL